MNYPYTIIKHKDALLLYKVLSGLEYNVSDVSIRNIIKNKERYNYIVVIIDCARHFNYVRFCRIGLLDPKIPRIFINDLSKFISECAKLKNNYEF